MAGQGRRWRIAAALGAAFLLGLLGLLPVLTRQDQGSEAPPARSAPAAATAALTPDTATPATEPAAKASETAAAQPAGGWAIRGRAWRRDAPGAPAVPAAGAVVLVEPIEWWSRPGRTLKPPPLTCDAEGRFEIVALDSWSEVELHIEAPPLAPRAVRVGQGGHGLRADIGDVLLLPGTEVVLRVEGPEGEPVADATVRMTRKAARHPDPAGGARIDEGALTAQPLGGGGYRVDLASSGSYEVSVEAAGHVERKQWVEVPAADSILIVLERGRRIAGGVRSEDGAPLGGATVHLKPLFGESSIDDATSDAAGRFAFDGLPAERYRLLAGADGFQDHTTLPFEAGTEDVDIVLERGADLTGRVVGEPDGAPVDDALVFVETENGGFETHTDAAGRYSLLGLPPGDLQLGADHPGYAPLSPVKLSLEKGASLKAPELRLPEGHTLEVRVVEEGTERPIAGARLEMAIGGSSSPRGNYRYFGPTLADGTKVLRGLSSATDRTVVARAEGYIVNELRHVEVPSPEPRLRLPLARACTVRGRVVDAAGAPVAEAIVWANVQREKPYSGSWRDGDRIASRSVRTDPDGRFVMDYLSPHAGYFLTVRHEAYPLGCVEGLDIAPDAPPAEVEIRLEAPASLEGEVLDPDGRPVASAGVYVRDRSSCGFSGTGRVMVHRAVAWLGPGASADAQGRFQVRGIMPGKCRVSAGGDGFLDAESRNIEIRAGETAFVRLVLRRGESLSGRAVDDTGAPLPGVEVELHSTSGRTLTDDGGGFHFPVVERGRAGGKLSKAGYKSLDFETEVPGAVLVLTLERLARVEGRVRTLDGGPFSELDVLAAPLEAGDRDSIDGRGDPDTGAFHVVVPAGRYALHVIVDGYLPAQSPELTLRPGELVRDLVLDVGRGGEVRGRVLLDSTGEPVRGAEVSVVGIGHDGPGSPWNLPFTSSRADGSFEIGGIPDGRIRLLATLEKLVPLTLPELDVVRGRSADVTLLLGPGGSLRGRIAPAGGFRGRGWVAQVVPGSIDTELRRTDVDAEGRFTLEGLSPASSLFRVAYAPPGDRPAVWFTGTAAIANGQQSTADFEPPLLVPFRGRVLRHGEPVDQALVSVHCLSAGGELALRVETRCNAAGEFELDVLPGVPCEVTAGIDDLPPLVTEITCEADTAPVELLLPGPAAAGEENR